MWAGTENGRLSRYVRQAGNVLEARGSLGGGCEVARIFADPLMRAALVFLRNKGAFHARATGPLRPRWIAQLRDIRLTAASWVMCGNRGAQRIVLLGSALGNVFALSLDEHHEENDRVKKLWAVPEGGCIDGVQVELVAGKYVAVVATRRRLYIFYDADSLKSLFDGKHLVSAVPRSHPDSSSTENLTVPLELQFATGVSAVTPRRFVWSNTTGVTHAQVAVRRKCPVLPGGTATEASGITASIVDKATILWSKMGSISGSMAPLSVNLSAFHILVLYPGSLLAFNQVSGELSQKINICSAGADVYEEREHGSVSMMRLLPPASGLVRDVSTDVLWVFSDDGQLARVVGGDRESAVTWRAAQKIRRLDLAMALAPSVGRGSAELARTRTTRHVVLCALAEHAGTSEDWEAASRLFGKTRKPIEEVILRIVERRDVINRITAVMSAGDCSERINAKHYVSEYLVRKLDEIESSCHTQHTLIGMALVQLYVGRISSEAGEKMQRPTRMDFISFLRDRCTYLDIPTTQLLLVRHNCAWECEELTRLAPSAHCPRQRSSREIEVDEDVLSKDWKSKQDPVHTSQPLVRVGAQGAVQALAETPRGGGSIDTPAYSAGSEHLQLLSVLTLHSRFAVSADARTDAYKSAVEHVRCSMESVRAFCPKWHQLLRSTFRLHVEFKDERGAAVSISAMLAPHCMQGPLTGAECTSLVSVLRTCWTARFRTVCVSLYAMLGLYDTAIALALEVDVTLAERTLRCAAAGGLLSQRKLRSLWRQVAKRSDRSFDVVACSERVLRFEDALQNMNAFNSATEKVRARVAELLCDHRGVARCASKEAVLASNMVKRVRGDTGRVRVTGGDRTGKVTSCGRQHSHESAINALDGAFETAELDLPLRPQRSS